MLDDFRQQASVSPFLEDDEPVQPPTPAEGHYLLGLSPLQRFIIALLLLFFTCLLGGFLLLITERVVLPFL